MLSVYQTLISLKPLPPRGSPAASGRTAWAMRPAELGAQGARNLALCPAVSLGSQLPFLSARDLTVGPKPTPAESVQGLPGFPCLRGEGGAEGGSCSSGYVLIQTPPSRGFSVQVPWGQQAPWHSVTGHRWALLFLPPPAHPQHRAGPEQTRREDAEASITQLQAAGVASVCITVPPRLSHTHRSLCLSFPPAPPPPSMPSPTGILGC